MAVLLTGTTIGGHSAIHAGNLATHGIVTTSNIGSYAITSIPTSFSSITVTSSFDTASNDIYASMRVIRNNSGSADGMYIGYGNSGSGITRIFGGGSTGGALEKYATYTYEPGSFRAPIFYDANDTTYYFNGDSTTSLRTRGSWRADSADWDGEYSGKIQYHSNHWYFQSGNLWIFRNAGGSNVFQVDQSGNGTFNGDIYLGTRGTWLSSYLNQDVRTSASPSFSTVNLNTLNASDTNARYYVQSTNGVPSNNLGNPTVTEMALFDEQFNNKTAFYDNTALSFWTSSDGTNYTEYTGFDTTTKKRFLGGDNDSGVFIPNLTNRFRIELENTQGYVFLNQLYIYWSSNSHSTKVHIWVRRCDNNQWYQWTDSNTQVSSWPGHLYLPFGGIPFYPGALASTGHYNRIRIEFIPTWSTGTYSTYPINLMRMQIWGGYPAGKRNIYSVDENQNVSFPATLSATTFSGGLSGNATTASALTSMNISQFTNNSGYITGYTETDTLATVTGRGATTASQLSFTKTDDHAISVGTIRGRAVGSQTGEFIHLYERVHIGSPSGWGGGNTAAPSYGLSVYGGATIGYGNSGGLTVTGTLSATNFSGTSSGTNTGDQTTITGNAGSATVLQTARTLTIGATGKTFNGSANVSWTLAEIGAQAAGSYAAASHTHDDRYYTETESDNRFVRKDTTGQYLKPYNEYTSNLPASSVASSIVSQMGGGGLRVDFLNGASFGTWAHAITFSGYNGYNMYQLAGHYKGSGGEGPDLYVRCEPNHSQNSWSSWEKLWHTGNDGSGSGLDADLLDGNHASAFALSSHTHGASSITSGTFGAGHYIFPYQSGITGASAPSYTQGAIEIYTDSNHVPAIGFHRGGHSATTLYEYDGQLYVNAWTTRAQTGLLLSTGNIGSYAAAVSHTHTIANVTGLQAALDGKQASGSYLTGNQTITLSGDVSGSGATSISVTVDSIDGWGFVNTGSNSGTNADTINSNGISYYTGGVTNFSGNATDGALYSQRYSDSWQHQIAGDYRSGQIALRGKNSGTWQAWRTVLDSSNFSTWAQPAGSYAAASHTHDDRYYTETESDGRFLKLAGGTTTGTVVMNGDNYLNGGLSGIKNIHYQYSGIGYTVTNGAAAWYRIAKLDNFGAGILILGFTNNGSINEVIYEITYWLGEGDNATIDLRKFGVDDYVTEARIVKNNSLYYIEAYFAAAPTTPQTYHSPEIFNVRTLGTNLNKVITVYTGNLSVTSGTQTTLVTKAFIDNGNTFSVTNATNATSTLAGLAVHSGRNNEADKVVRTDVNGYIQAGWINTTSGNTTSTITDIYVNTNDGYIRKATPAHFRSQITDGVYAPVSHTHSIANVTGLQAALDGKQASGSYLTSLGFSYSTGVTANHVVQRDANGYIYANHINFSTGETENPTISSFFVSNGDGWSRKASVAHVKSQLGLGSAAYVATSTFADASHTHTFASLTSKPTTISGYGITDAITTGNIGSQSVSRASGVSITGFGTDSFTYHQTPGNVHSWTGGWASHFIGNHGNGDTYYSQSIIMPFWGVPRYQRNEAGAKVGPWQFITEENIATQSVSFATTSGSATSSTTANRLDNYGINYGSDWNTWGVYGKLVASSYHANTGANKPPTYTYGSFLSFLNAGADSFQIAIPENQYDGTGKQRAMHYRSAWNGTWSSWRQVVDIQNNVCDILADGNSTLIVRQGVGYNQPFNSNIEIHGSVDDWAYGKFRFRVQNEAGTEPVYGAQFRIERFSVNTGWQLLGMVPRGSQNLEWQGDILPGLSDQRVKENVVTLTDGVATIQQINPVEFDWKPVENVSEREGHDIGFIAQQLEEIVPTAVHTRSDGYKTVKYEKVVPILVQAIKEQQSLIEQLTARIEALENR